MAFFLYLYSSNLRRHAGMRMQLRDYQRFAHRFGTCLFSLILCRLSFKPPLLIFQLALLIRQTRDRFAKRR